jgi:hypothetical protein
MKRSFQQQASWDRWFDRATLILEGRANGLGTPVLRALALRGHKYSMHSLAAMMCDPRSGAYDPVRGWALTRLLARHYPDSTSLENLATEHRNRNNMAGYRYWLTRAARIGDPEVERERRGFRTRFPYAIMRRWERYRPPRKGVDY